MSTPRQRPPGRASSVAEMITLSRCAVKLTRRLGRRRDEPRPRTQQGLEFKLCSVLFPDGALRRAGDCECCECPHTETSQQVAPERREPGT